MFDYCCDEYCSIKSWQLRVGDVWVKIARRLSCKWSNCQTRELQRDFINFCRKTCSRPETRRMRTLDVRDQILLLWIPHSPIGIIRQGTTHQLGVTRNISKSASRFSASIGIPRVSTLCLHRTIGKAYSYRAVTVRKPQCLDTLWFLSLHIHGSSVFDIELMLWDPYR